MFSQELSSALHPDNGALSFSTKFYNLYSENSLTRRIFSDGHNFGIDFQYPTNFGTFAVDLNQNSLSFYHEDKTNGLKFNLLRSDQSCEVSYLNSFEWLSIKGGIQYLRTKDQPLFNYNAGFGFSFQGKDFQNYEVMFSRSNLPFSFSAVYETDNAYFINPLSFLSMEHKLCYRFSSFLITSAFAKYYPKKMNQDFFYSLSDQSDINEWNARLKYENDRSQFNFDIQNVNMRSEIDLSQQNLSFGYINIKNIDFLKGELSFSHRFGQGSILSVFARYYYANGNLVGSLESWPFASVIQSLFLNRLYFRASGNLNAQEIDASFLLPLKDFIVTPRLSFVRVVPELTVETWQPLFLAFGASNYSKSQLSFTEAGFLYLNIFSQFKFWGLSLGIEANQILPLYSVSPEKSAQTPSPSPVGSESTSKKTDGGRWFRLWIGIPLQ